MYPIYEITIHSNATIMGALLYSIQYMKFYRITPSIELNQFLKESWETTKEDLDLKVTMQKEAMINIVIKEEKDHQADHATDEMTVWREKAVDQGANWREVAEDRIWKEIYFTIWSKRLQKQKNKNIYILVYRFNDIPMCIHTQYKS